MDLTRNILYRDFYLNDENIHENVTPGDSAGGGISGCSVEAVDFSDVDVVQFKEKRSQADGMDAGQPFLGERRINMTGTLYGLTRALLYDAYLDLRAALSPTLAYLDEPADKGFQPLYFSVPTNDAANFPLLAIDMRVLALPRAFEANFQRDLIGGDDDDQLALPWQAVFVCKDPSIMHDTPQDFDLSGGDDSGDLDHRGNYPSPLNALITVGVEAGTIVFTLGGTTLTITVPAGADGRIFRYKGDDKLLTVEEGSVEVPRMDLLSLSGTAHPLVPPGVGTNPYDVNFTTVVPQAGSHFWYWERWA